MVNPSIEGATDAEGASIFRDTLLDGKVAFVTGGATGICFRIAEYLVRHGCQVAIGSRRLNVLADAKTKLDLLPQIQGREKGVLIVQLDVRQESSCQNAIRSTIDHFGRCDILINGAAGNFLCPAENLSANAFRTVLDIDTTGTFLMSQQVFKQWMKTNGGSIVNITATLHYNGELFQVHAGSAKSAVEAMTRHLANEWGKFGVRVNNIAPGPIADTVGMAKLGGPLLGADKSSTYINRIALRRLGTTQDIAQAALFVCSNAASYMTGTTLTVDGGSWFFAGGMLAGEIQRMQAKQRSSKL